MTKSEQINELAGALAKVQARLLPAGKNKKNPFLDKDYADLKSIWGACRDLLVANDLAVIQTTEVRDGVNVLVTILAHKSGQYVTGELLLKPVKDDPPSTGAAISYARRQSLAAIVGVVVDDDDDATNVTSHQPKNTPSASNSSGKPTILDHCTYGKDKGVKWSDMTAQQRDNYKTNFTKTLNDPKEKKFHAWAKAELNGVVAAIIAAAEPNPDGEAPGA